jgi:hypothetical protein
MFLHSLSRSLDPEFDPDLMGFVDPGLDPCLESRPLPRSKKKKKQFCSNNFLLQTCRNFKNERKLILYDLNQCCGAGSC